MKKRTIVIRILIAVVILFFLMTSTMIVMITGPIELTLNQRSFETVSFETIEKSAYQNNGSWWGYNQKKIAVLGDVSFSFDYDNSNYETGNPSLTNPYQCVFHHTIDGVKETFGTAATERPCNVVADRDRMLVYYFVVEPTGENIGTNGNTAMARTMMYVYHFDATLQTTDLLRVEEVDPPSSIGKIRQSVAIDASGNLAVAYGEYSGIMTVLTYDVQNNLWHKHQTLSNPDQDSLMYCYVELVDLDEIYTLCVQDTSRDGETYYQYVKLFAYESGVWSDYMVVDYRDHPKAIKESHMVEHTEFKRIDGKLHIITRSNPLSEIRHFIYESHQITELTTTLKGRNGWVRLLYVDETLYYVTTKLSFIPMVEIIEVETGKVVYQAIGMAMGSYLYLGEAMTSGEIPILFYPGWDMRYEASDAKILLIRFK
jgi:hypothetical protein